MYYAKKFQNFLISKYNFVPKRNVCMKIKMPTVNIKKSIHESQLKIGIVILFIQSYNYSFLLFIFHSIILNSIYLKFIIQ